MNMNDVVTQIKMDLRKQVRELLVENLTKSMKIKPSSAALNLNTADKQKIAEYLKRSGYDYALSVFLSEANVNNLQGPDNAQSEPNVVSSAKLDMKEVAEQLWGRLERKYRAKMKQQARNRKDEMKRKIKLIEERFTTALLQKEEEMKEEFEERLEALRRKEEAIVGQAQRDHQNLEKSVNSKRQDLILQVKELERRRDQLQQLEEEFQRHTANEEARTRSEREQMSLKQLELKRAQFELNQRIELEVSRAKENFDLELSEKLKEKEDKIGKLEAEIAGLKDGLRESQSAKSQSTNRMERIRNLESQMDVITSHLDHEKSKNEELQSRLRQFGDYDKLKREIGRLKVELESTRSQNPGLKRVKELELELKMTRDQREMDLRTQTMREEDWKIKSESEKSRYEDLMKLFKTQSQQIRDLNKELNRLRLRLEPKPQKKKAAAIATRFERSADSEETSTDSTPDYVKEARTRMAKLDAESEALNESIRLYERLSEAKTGQKISFASPAPFKYSEYLPSISQYPPHESTELKEKPDQEKTLIAPAEERTKSPPLIPLADTPKVKKKKEKTAAEKSYVLPSPSEKNPSGMLTSTPKQSENKELKKEEKRDAEESRRTEKENRQKEEQGEKAESSKQEPEIDPEMQKYMALVMSQRAKEKKNTPKRDKSISDHEIEDPVVDTAKLSGPSDDEAW